MGGKKYKKSFKTIKKRKLFRSRFFWLSFFIISLLIGVVYLLFFSSAFKIIDVKIMGNQEVKEDDIKNIILENIKINQNIFLCDTKRGEKTVLEKLPKIADVKISRVLPTTISVEVGERKPVVFLERENAYYSIDKEGVLFEKLSEIPIGAVKIKKEGNNYFKIGEKLIDNFIIGSIVDIENSFKNDINIGLSEIIIVSDNRINVKTLEGWEVYFNPKGKISEKISELKTLLRGKIPLGLRKNIEYIDLRFEKIYVYPGDYASKNPIEE